MVENEVKKIERDEIIVCGACNNAIPKDFLERNIGGLKNLYCQYCGVSLNLDFDLKTNNEYGESHISAIYTQEESNLTNIQQNSKESDFTLSYSNIRNALRGYIFQLIYRLLTKTPLTLKKIKNKKELKSSHINIILKKLWNELKDLNPNDLANQELVSSRRRIRNYFEKFQLALRPYKQFRKNNFTLFAENIEFVFGLILGDYEFSNLTTSKKRIVLDLKKNFGFRSDTATTNSFTYNISLIVSKKIRSIVSQYHITEGKDNRLALNEIISHVIDFIVTNNIKLYDLSEFNNSKKKKFYKTLEILIANLKTDWIYRISFEDHIYKLIIIVNSLMSDINYSSNLIGFERFISQGLTQSALFEKDQDFSPHFKLNLTLILCRIINLKIKNFPDITKLNSQSVNLSITEENEVSNYILDEITARKMFNSQILKKFYKVLLEEFQTYYEKLQYKLNSDLIYIESFRVYISDLVKLVFNIVHSISKKSHLTKLELAVIKDLANYNFEWFNKKRGRTYFYYPLQIIPDKSAIYHTLKLIEDMKIEIQQFSEELAMLFPDRLMTEDRNIYSHVWLSQLWGKGSTYVRKSIIRKAKDYADFRIKEEALLLLREKLEEILGVKALGCLKIIRKYQGNEINTLQFVDLLEKELGRVSGEIKVTDEELSLILAGTHTFIKSIKGKIRTPSHSNYNPHYKFSKERLSEFKDFLFEIFGDRVKKCSEMLDRFERLNPDLKEYSLQQYTITEPNYFQNIKEKIFASYWFGFLRADGSRAGDPYRVTFALAEKDRDSIEDFAKAVGFPLDRISPRTRYQRYKGKLKAYRSLTVQFRCRPMVKDIDDLGFQSSKAEQKYVPNYVMESLKEAKKIVKQTKVGWWLTTPGKLALAFLLGYYDGDGEYLGGRTAKIYSSSKSFLEHISELFGIKNKVYPETKPGEEAWAFDRQYISKGLWAVYLGPEVFEMMMNSYEKSMKRKRLLYPAESLNFIGDQI
jgi:hypothetical protein